MGPLQSTFSTPSTPHIHYEQQNWLILQQSQSNVTEMGTYTILKNNITNEVVRMYVLHFDNRNQFQLYIEEFDHWRVMARWNVVQAKYLSVDKNLLGLGGFCASFFQLHIFLENPVLLLSQIKDIPPPESLYILLSALVGFEHLWQIFGYFPLTQQMINVNELGIVKVWINPDLSKNRPNYINRNNLSLQHMQTPKRFILELIELIENNTDCRQLPTTFRQFVQNKQKPKISLTFSNCRKLLLDFAQDNKIDIPDSLISILDLLFEKTNRSNISQQQNLVNEELYSNTLYGKNYMVGGYLLDGQEDNGHEDELGHDNEFTSGDRSKRHEYKLQSRGQMIESFQQYPQTNQQISRQVNNIVQKTKSIHNLTPSGSSNHISSRQPSYNTLSQTKNIVGLQSPSETPPSQYEYGHHHQHSHGTIYTNSYQNQQYRVPQLPLMINFTHNNETMIYNDNPYNSLVQRQGLQRQSTIREQPEEDSFMTSRLNSKFQTSRDLRRTSNQLKKTYKNMQTHRQAFSSHSQSRLNIQNYSPRQVQLREESQSGINPVQNPQLQHTKRSGKSIQFYTPNEMKEIDAQIAEDLEYLMASLKETKQIL